jgi:hypothetical protein
MRLLTLVDRPRCSSAAAKPGFAAANGERQHTRGPMTVEISSPASAVVQGNRRRRFLTDARLVHDEICRHPAAI